MADYCFAALGEHEQNQCGELLFGGSDAVAVLELDHAINDWTDESEWAAAIAADKARIVKGVKGNFPDPSPVTSPNPQGCGPANKTTGYDYTFAWLDSNVNGVNDVFYSDLNKRTLYLVWFECSEGEIRVVERKVLFQAFPASLPEANTDYQAYNVTATWSAPVDWYAPRYAAPTGIFE